MRILVTGASGLLGLNMSLAALSSHQVIGVDRSKLADVPFELLNLDLLETGALDGMLERVKPDWLIHCAALADVDACEADPAGSLQLNARLPGILAEGCARRSIRMVHISTDAVLDGTRSLEERLYTETDTPNPLGVYARTKLEGEQSVLRVNPEAIVARVNFFGWSLNGKRSLAEFFVNHLRAGKIANGFTDVYFCPMFVGDLAETLLSMLENKLTGLYHVVGSQSLSKYEFGLAIANQFGFDPGLIKPMSVDQSDLVARRSRNLRLSVHKLSTALGRSVPGFSTGLARFYTQAQQGYPQKIAGYQQKSTQL
jgi:dTDP-4-dehydrorhamnose reductase